MYYGERHNQRVKNICQILLELADGNFSYRIPRTKEDDMLESLTVLVNWLAEEMQESLFHIGYVNPHISYHYTVQGIFILDEEGIINDFSSHVSKLLEIDPNKLLGLGFSELLAKDSQTGWQTAKNKLSQNKTDHISLLLNFSTANKLLLRATCNAFLLFKQKKIMLSLFNATIKGKEENESREQKNIHSIQTKIHSGNTQVIQSVYDYILAHKDAPIPTIKELARIFGTNEFKLKAGFRYLFKTSIYQLYTDVRLKRAHLLIKNTGIPLKEIAFMSGYNTYPNFSRAFKIKYKYTPGSLRRSTPK